MRKQINLLMYKYYFIIIILLTSCSSSVKITYEPIGESDKPLPYFTIENHIDNKNINHYNVDNKTIDQLVDNIENNLTVFHDTANNYYEFGTYKITTSENGEKNTYWLNSREQSIVFFENQQNIVKDNPQVYNKFENLIKRIKW